MWKLFVNVRYVVKGIDGIETWITIQDGTRWFEHDLGNLVKYVIIFNPIHALGPKCLMTPTVVSDHDDKYRDADRIISHS